MYFTVAPRPEIRLTPAIGETRRWMRDGNVIEIDILYITFFRAGID